jgi:hypothetical protein
MKNIIKIGFIQIATKLYKQTKLVSFMSYPCPEWCLTQGTDNRKRDSS